TCRHFDIVDAARLSGDVAPVLEHAAHVIEFHGRVGGERRHPALVERFELLRLYAGHRALLTRPPRGAAALCQDSRCRRSAVRPSGRIRGGSPGSSLTQMIILVPANMSSIPNANRPTHSYA